MKNKLIVILLCCIAASCYSQVTPEKYAHGIFRGTRIVNGHSIETLRDGEMEMIIGHRFGRLNGGGYELFGLDESAIRLGLDYGLRDWLTIGAGRSSLGKEFDGFFKLRILRQGAKGQGGMPVSLTAFSSMAYKTLRAADATRPLEYQNRMAFTGQILIARKISDRFSVQLMPTLVHFNLVENRNEPNDKVVIGAALKYQISKNWAFTSEYYQALPDQLLGNKKNSFSVGLDLNTGSHVFQLHFTNSAGMIEKQFIGETTGDWGNGDIHFGFNMVRTFKLKGRRY
ncbi:MAG: DUF5777 family beta-barrel protein [Saprospiraceae bacterium]